MVLDCGIEDDMDLPIELPEKFKTCIHFLDHNPFVLTDGLKNYKWLCFQESDGFGCSFDVCGNRKGKILATTCWGILYYTNKELLKLIPERKDLRRKKNKKDGKCI